jgi:glycosyltransferase EpsH
MAGLLGEETADPSNADSLATAWGKLYRADILRENSLRFVDTKLIGTEDALFNLYCFGYVHKAVFINRPFNHYRKDNDSSLTRSYKPELFSRWNELYDRMEKYIEENQLSQDFKKALNNRICFSIIGLGLTELLNTDKIARVKNIKKFISTDRYKQAYKSLDIKYLPIHWKLFFSLCKCRCAVGIYFLIKVMYEIIEK